MRNNKYITMIVSLLAAILLWLYVVTVVNPDGDTTITGIPVTFTGVEVLREDHGLTIMDGYEDTVAVRFFGKNADLKKLENNADEIVAVVDVSKVRNAKEYSLSYDLTLPSSIQRSAVEIADQRPGSITFSVERIVSRSVEVVGDFSDVEIADGYMLESTGFDYDFVTVEGPESVVNTIDHAQLTMSRTNVDKSISESLEYELVDSSGAVVDREGLTVDTEVIETALSVVMYKVVPLEVTFIDGGGATGADVSYKIEPETVTLSGDGSVLESVNTIALANIDLADTENNVTLNYPIMIPNDAKNVSGEEEASITIKIKNKESAVIRTSNISFTNKAEGIIAESIAQQLQVTVRSAPDDLETITANHLRVVADLSEYTQPGTYQVPAEIYIDGHPEAGVIGEYSIAVSVREEETVPVIE